METLKVKNLGPIESANISFGDLTLFVGPQATGKSILLQLIKLLADKAYVHKTFEEYGFAWGETQAEVLDRYFGEGMSEIWTPKTQVTFDGKSFPTSFLKKGRAPKVNEESLFYVPAQRIICLQNGWPRFFRDYEDSVPFVLRHFSESLRLFLEMELNRKDDTLFPEYNRLKRLLRQSFDDNIFYNGKVVIDKSIKKRLKLEIGESSIPFMVWSTGQKEFMPLLLSFYWLCPFSRTSRRDQIRYVLIEEPEMGLHPQAVKAVLLQIIDLMSRGYKIVISTHSPVLLEFAWAFKHLQENNADYQALMELFDLKDLHPYEKKMLNNVIKEQTIKTFYFDQKNGSVKTKDISSLDAGSEDDSVSEWGGLSSFATKAVDIVLKFSTNEQ